MSENEEVSLKQTGKALATMTLFALLIIVCIAIVAGGVVGLVKYIAWLT